MTVACTIGKWAGVWKGGRGERSSQSMGYSIAGSLATLIDSTFASLILSYLASEEASLREDKEREKREGEGNRYSIDNQMHCIVIKRL